MRCGVSVLMHLCATELPPIVLGKRIFASFSEV